MAKVTLRASTDPHESLLDACVPRDCTHGQCAERGADAATHQCRRSPGACKGGAGRAYSIFFLDILTRHLPTPTAPPSHLHHVHHAKQSARIIEKCEHGPQGYQQHGCRCFSPSSSALRRYARGGLPANISLIYAPLYSLSLSLSYAIARTRKLTRAIIPTMRLDS